MSQCTMICLRSIVQVLVSVALVRPCTCQLNGAVGLDASGRLVLNGSTGQPVLISGVNAIDRIERLESTVSRLEAELSTAIVGLTHAPSIPPTESPTSPSQSPTASPTSVPSPSPTMGPTRTPTPNFHVNVVAMSNLERLSVSRRTVLKYTSSNNQPVLAFTVEGGPVVAEILMVGGGGSGGDGNAAGGGGSAGALVVGNVTIRPGQYFVKVGSGGRAPHQDSPGYCGQTSIFRTPYGDVVAPGGSGGNGYSGATLSHSSIRGSCQGYEGGGGGSGPRTSSLRRWNRASMPNNAINGISVQTHVGDGYPYARPYGGGGGGAGGNAVSQNGGPGYTSDFDGTSRSYAGGGGGACYPASSSLSGGVGGSRVGGKGGRHPRSSASSLLGHPPVANTGSGGGGCPDNNFHECVGANGIVMIRFPLLI